MHPPALAVINLACGYANRPTVLQGVSLVVHPAERVGLIGPNGSGKTTLFLAICGILKPQAGTVALFGQPVVAGQFYPSVGMLFQNPDEQLFCPSVRDDIAFGVVNLGLAPAEVAARVAQAMEQTGVSHLADRVPHHLSGGEKRMVAIAGVIAMQPRLILYDEPDAYLDRRARRRLVQFLLTHPAASLIASHDLELIAEVCQRVVVLDEGRLVADGLPPDILSNAALMERHGLEVPSIYR
ncbi:MAG: energy-coupling factor ABC transporter ATP-binding protein [Chloroflexaceae bacterium]|nr:energy-coupling factor ABC transporter ATP-binding protein [Chloroflexaceae bacterium]